MSDTPANGAQASPPSPSAPPLHFELELQPARRGQRWHAELRGPGGDRLDFTSPLALTRHLAAIGAETPAPGGLR